MKSGKCLLISIFFLASFCHTNSSHATTTASDLKRHSERFLDHLITQQNLTASHYEIGQIDPRLQLPTCEQPLNVALFNPPTPLSGRITLKIQCDTPSPWKIYVKATLHVMKNVVVALRPLSRGYTLTPEDVRLETRPLSSLKQNYLENTTAVSGKKLRQAVAAGTVISATSLDNARLVIKNQQVTISSGSNASINVKTNGVALRDGNLGDRITVRNSSSGKMIEATVIGAGLVSVNP
jgi:flagella basal body P-ring formation protein FlgA